MTTSVGLLSRSLIVRDTTVPFSSVGFGNHKLVSGAYTVLLQRRQSHAYRQWYT